MSRIKDSREVILTSDTTAEHFSAAVWDPSTGSMLSSYKGAGSLSPGSLQLLSDSYLIAADAMKPRIHVWALNNPQPAANLRLTTPGKVTALLCTPNGSYIIAAVAEKLFIWQSCNGRLLVSLNQHYQAVGCLSCSGDGSVFASGAEDGLIFIWSLYKVVNDERGTPMHGLSQHSMPVRDLCFGRGARGRLYSVSIDRTCNIYDPSSGTLLLTLVLDVPLNCVQPNGKDTDLFVGCTDGRIYQFNLHEPPRATEHHVQVRTDEGGEGERVVFKGHKSGIVSLSISIDCRYLLSAGVDGKAHVWDIPSRQILRTIDHSSPIGSAFFAKRYENFRVVELRPRVKLTNLQRISDEPGKESFIHVITKDRNPLDILDFQSFVQSSHGELLLGDVVSRKLAESRKEIDRLRRINTEIYQYSINCILNKPRSF